MPTLLLDKRKCLRNIEAMSGKAADHKLSFRPHFKTHQSAEIGNWLRDFGVTKITVASFKMASYFARAGWNNILVAFPFNPHDLDTLNALAENHRISILVDHPHALVFLDRVEHHVDFYVDIDTGYHRTGIKAEDTEKIQTLLATARTNKNLNFKGFYCHAGHSYKAKSAADMEQIHFKATSDLAALKNQFATYSPVALYGDTPNCSTQENFPGIDEITPGNFVFYDLMQYTIGSCSLDDIAVALACPVVSKYPEPERVVVHGGAVHFSKETARISEKEAFGKGVRMGKGEWETSSVEYSLTAISQEHGIIEDAGSMYERVEIGESLHFLPAHSCLTANLMKEYQTLEGNIIKTIHS